jgi:predicted choloylglycine hydrolase
MDPRPNLRNVTFTHSVLEGSAYEVGRMRGELLAERSPRAAEFFTSPPPNREPLSPKEIDAALSFFRKHTPGLEEEMAGFAKALGAPPERSVYYAVTYQGGGHCSHFAVLPSISADGRLRVGRSYEFSHEQSDLRLVTMRIDGRPAHVGFSEVLFGRDDGLNEHGLCATISAGAPMAPTQPGGCMFWAVVRTVLDRCANVEDAVELVQTIPVSFNFNLILADRTGRAALMEIACSHRAVKRIDSETPESFLLSTNHSNLPEMKPHDLGRMWNSLVRYKTIRKRLEDAAPRVSFETIKGILSEVYPNGTCCHHYSDYLGTLWAGVFDLQDRKLDVCFGAPTHNQWHSFQLNEQAGTTDFAVTLPDIPAAPSLFRKLAPGTEE